MSQSLSNVLVHLVFSTKERRPFLKEEQLRDDTIIESTSVLSIGNCWNDMELNTTNGTCGIDLDATPLG
jgi:hypothetical protein